MNDVNKHQFNHIKIHTQYSICEGALRTADLANYCKTNKVHAVGLCDSYNLCGALEFSETIAKSKTQPIIGSQINIKYKDNYGKLPLFAKNLIDSRISPASILFSILCQQQPCCFSFLIKAQLELYRPAYLGSGPS